jgi:hypothetical protein
MLLPQQVSVRLCIAARSGATRAQRNVAPSYSQTWNAAIVREISFLSDRCKKDASAGRKFGEKFGEQFVFSQNGVDSISP